MHRHYLIFSSHPQYIIDDRKWLIWLALPIPASKHCTSFWAIQIDPNLARVRPRRGRRERAEEGVPRLSSQAAAAVAAAGGLERGRRPESVGVLGS
uniref:Uncharacterized protein n=1 Tax=Arundo donax TaxID=35708 RepID=A0A0A9EGW5_ARUDO